MDTQQHDAAPAWIAPGEPIISLRGVTKSFGSHTVLEDITFDVPKGRITSILGPSGTGKSVLLKNILGLLRPERGEIWVDGDQIVGLRERRLYEVRKKFGVLFQDGAPLRVDEPLRQHRLPAARAHAGRTRRRSASSSIATPNWSASWTT